MVERVLFVLTNSSLTINWLYQLRDTKLIINEAGEQSVAEAVNLLTWLCIRWLFAETRSISVESGSSTITRGLLGATSGSVGLFQTVSSWDRDGGSSMPSGSS